MDALQASYAFANSLKKDDWVAVTYFDMQPHILVDFTQDKKAVYGALNQLRIPGFAETNVFDALYDTLDRLDRVEGKKYIILVTTGVDTFSKITYDKILKKVKDTPDVTIFPISVGFMLREYCETHPGSYYCGQAHGMGIPVSRMDYVQGDNEMRTFAAMTGGRAYFPRFEAEYSEEFQDIGQRHSQSVFHLVPPNQYEARWHIPQAESADCSARRWAVEGEGPEG